MPVLTRKEKANLTRTETFVRDRIEKTVRGINPNDITFLDEIYYLVDARTESLEYLAAVRLPLVDDLTPLESSLYNNLAGDIRELSELNIETIKDVYDSLNDVYGDILSAGESIASSLSQCSSLLNKVEGTLKSKMSLASVKNEIVAVALNGTIGIGDSTATPDSSIVDTSMVVGLPGTAGDAYGSEGTDITAIDSPTIDDSTDNGSNSVVSQFTSTPIPGLNIDQYGGFITLMPASMDPIECKVKGVKFSKPKGVFGRPHKPQSGGTINIQTSVADLSCPPEYTMDFFNPPYSGFDGSVSRNLQNGYFYTRIFSEDPIFENQFASATDPLIDNDLETDYLVEYNSTTADDSLGVEITLDTTDQNGSPTKVDQVVIELSTGDMTSVSSTDIKVPKLSRLLLDQDDFTADALVHTVVVEGVKIGTDTTGFKAVATTANPKGSFMTSGKMTSQLTIGMLSNDAQKIWYPEKVLVGDNNSIIRTMNYFETLVVDGYEPPLAHPNPSSMYTPTEINHLMEAEASAHNSWEEHREMYRFFVDIKDILAYSITYETIGQTISGDMGQLTTQLIASVQLYVNETVPEGTSISYFVSPDRKIWIPIWPANRAGVADETVGVAGGAVAGGGGQIGVATPVVATRIMYKNIGMKPGDQLIGSTSEGIDSHSAYLKIVMTGDGSNTPRLKAYVLRCKLV